jgi:leukotriene-A4 hydrolase
VVRFRRRYTVSPVASGITHLILDLTADFDTRRLSGTAELHVDGWQKTAAVLTLDTRALDIHGVETARGDGAFASTTFALGPDDPAFGSVLQITMPAGADRARVHYTTSPQAKGLQWLTPEQTAGKTKPFMFTQAQAIQARSFIPLQDTPSVRLTYDATIRVPRGLVAVMGAERIGSALQSDDRHDTFRFHMPQPIPSYLIALAIGDLVFRPMSDRTGIWAEPVSVDAAVAEFEDTEQMMQATEAMYGPYRWGRYDILVMPSSFPFGGMENPRLTFATPTVIAGDKSLVSLVAHELAHSWSGNLVTNATWQDFWLNEGFTVYIERRIIEAVFGPARAQMDAVIALKDLADARATISVPGDRTLQPDLTGRDPDEAYSVVPYEQGALFLTWIESRVGRPAFDAFVREWFDSYAFQSVTTAQFLEFLRVQLLAQHPGAVDDAEIHEWLHTEGIPSFAVLPASDAFVKVDAARHAWLDGGTMRALAAAANTWTPQEWIHFIDGLPRDLALERVGSLDAAFALTNSRNAEIAHVWFRLALAAGYTSAGDAIERYLIRIGRRKLIVPLYQDLAPATARRIYAIARPGYHPLTQATLDRLLGT